MPDDELRERAFNNVIDRYLTSGTMSAEDYHNLTPLQKTVVQVIKRAFKRLNNRR